ncbi:MAG: ArsA family ATPase [Deltaproteobacteria bacterium]|nr:ArsA family ATPase [Deltaproteobacteria bacterium]
MKPLDLCPVMLFSGKGGVGKTTLAAATAVRLARSGSRVLVVSTDPAHSLSDAFDQPLGPTPRELEPGLEAMEVDASAMFTAALDEPPSEAMGSTLKRLMDMASQTPGVDEFAAIEVLLNAAEHAQHDVVILDTAPTGHTLRLLALPELLDGWLGTLLSLKDQFARASRLLRKLIPGGKASTAALQDGLSGSRDRVSKLRTLLQDPERAQIFLVTIPEAMSVLETLRTLQLLHEQRLPVGSVIVNQMQPEPTVSSLSGEQSVCSHCLRRRAIHERSLNDLQAGLGSVPMRVLESLSTEVRGADALANIARLLWQSNSNEQPSA